MEALITSYALMFASLIILSFVTEGNWRSISSLLFVFGYHSFLRDIMENEVSPMLDVDFIFYTSLYGSCLLSSYICFLHQHYEIKVKLALKS